MLPRFQDFSLHPDKLLILCLCDLMQPTYTDIQSMIERTAAREVQSEEHHSRSRCADLKYPQEMAQCTMIPEEQTMTVIAMTREIGSLGTEVAAGVAKRLGLEIVRSEIAANNVARRLGVAESVVTRYLDGSASLVERWQINRASCFITLPRKSSTWPNGATS